MNKLSYRDFGTILERNGWKENEETEDVKNTHYYEMTLLSNNYNTTVRIWISESKETNDINGRYGVWEIEISDYEYPKFPFDESALKDMLYAIELAENNLLTIGIPFSPTYRFHGRNAANKKRRNKTLRKKFNLLQDERESYRRALSKRRDLTPEEIEAAVMAFTDND